jgi:hypothetical protein
MFIAPLVTGIGAGRLLGFDTILLGLAALGFFLLRYPLMLFVRYGSRALDERSDSLRWSALYAGFTALFGGWLVISSGQWLLALVGGVGGLTLVAYLFLAARRAEMSTLGEMIGIAGLALGAPAAYLVATHGLDGAALALYLLNMFYFGGTVLYIKFKVRQQPRLHLATLRNKIWAGRVSIAYHITVMGLAVVSGLFGFIPAIVCIAFAITMCKVVGGVLNRPAKLNIRRLGIIEVGFTLAFLGIVLFAYR